VFEMAALIQSPAKCELRSVIRFLNAKDGRPGEIHTQKKLLFMITQRFPLVCSPKETSRWENFDDDDEVQEEVMTCFNGQAANFYDSGMQKLVPKLNKYLDNAGDYVEK